MLSLVSDLLTLQVMKYVYTTYPGSITVRELGLLFNQSKSSVERLIKEEGWLKYSDSINEGQHIKQELGQDKPFYINHDEFKQIVNDVIKVSFNESGFNKLGQTLGHDLGQKITEFGNLNSDYGNLIAKNGNYLKYFKSFISKFAKQIIVFKKSQSKTSYLNQHPKTDEQIAEIISTHPAHNSYTFGEFCLSFIRVTSLTTIIITIIICIVGYTS